ncbi:MAG: hypothetical protein IPG79_18060 [Saprospiraceae bacterium]|nr:hypothetical protein [Saprospiraceae bacterium]
MNVKFAQILFIMMGSIYLHGQAKIGLHSAFSEYMGPQLELSLEAPVYKNFSITIRGSGNFQRSFQYRGGIRYSPLLFGKTRLKAGLDFGSFMKINPYNELHKMHGKIRGLTLGIQQGVGKKWSLLGEFSALEYFENDWKRYLSAGIHFGVMYNFSD